MFSLVTSLLLLFGVLHDSWGQELGDGEVTDETLARQWLDEYNRNKAKWSSETWEGAWNYYSNMTTENAVVAVNLELRQNNQKMRFPYYIAKVIISICNKNIYIS